MRVLILLLTFSCLFIGLTAQTTSKEKMKKKEIYIRQASEAIGKQIAFTEIEIDASPERVRKVFLEFEKWPEWNPVVPKIAVKSGDINDLSTKPTLDLMLDFGRKGDPSKAPVYPKVYDNNEEVFNWGFKVGFVVSAVHVFIFEPINNGKGTRLVHYEKMSGMLKYLVMSKKTKLNMIERYNTMNVALKERCEASL